jgi:NAD(P)-dependent dehydrogenase (short-subunit alcohol dehydrogenase family)
MPAGRGAVAVVTGGGSGIGRAICRHLGAHGASVLVADLDLDAARATAAAVRARGGQSQAMRVDVAREPDVESAVAAAVGGYGRIDYLFNNAGISVNGEFGDISPQWWRRVVDVDLWGVVYGCRAAWPHMVAQGSGHIVNTASLAGLIPGGLTTPYSAAKHAVVGFSLTLRGEARQYGIKVSALCPGYLRTGIQEATPVVTGYLDSPANRRREAATTSLTAEDCVGQMMRGVARNKAIIFSPNRQRVYWWLNRVAPGLAPYAWHRAIRSLKRGAPV